jgi:hypothetical protein
MLNVQSPDDDFVAVVNYLLKNKQTLKTLTGSQRAKTIALSRMATILEMTYDRLIAALGRVAESAEVNHE